MRLVTTWYGSFVVEEDGTLLASAPFPKDASEIAERLRLVREGEVLDEELRVAPSGEGFSVTEDRLLALDGAVRTEEGASQVGVPGPEEVGMPPEVASRSFPP